MDAAHQRGIAVIVDVVYNHLGYSAGDMWQFDGWSENGKGGIYFYNDSRSSTAWGETRFDYGRTEVRQYGIILFAGSNSVLQRPSVGFNWVHSEREGSK